MYTVGERVRKRRMYLNMTQDELASRVGYASKAMISKIENDQTGAPLDNIEAIASVLNVKPSYLVGWSDDDSPVRHSAQISQTISTMEKMNESGQNHVRDFSRELYSTGLYNLREWKDKPNRKDTTIGISEGRGAAGSGAYNDGYEHVPRTLKTEDLIKHDIQIDVTGESMSPTIKDGDVVFIKFNPDRVSGKIYAVNVEDVTYIKRCYFEDDKLILKSDNPDYDDIVIKGILLQMTQIVGRVVGWATPVE